jgi:hypothetical protein
MNIGGVLTYEDVTSVDSVGVITARDAIVISEDNAIHFRGTDADDNDAILRASADGGQLLINSRNDAIINIDTNNDSTDAHFAVAHGAATGSSTELLRVQENGNIGIGTDNPQTLLHLKSDDPTLRIQRYDQNAYADVTADTSGKITFKSDPGNSANGDGFSFTVNNSEKLHIDSSGVIDFTGPGYTAGSNSCFIKQDSSGEGYLYNRGNNDLLFGTNNTEAFRITNQRHLRFADASADPAGGSNIWQKNGLGLALMGGQMAFYTGTNERARIDSSGRLLLAPTMSQVENSRAMLNVYAPTSGNQTYKSIEIGSNASNNAATGSVIAGRSFNNAHQPYVLLGGWDAGQTTGTNDVYLGGGWGTAARAATRVRLFTSTYQTTTASSGTERFELNQTGKLVVGPNVTRVRKSSYEIEYPLEVTSTNNSLDGGGIYTNNGIGWYGSFMGGGADNSTTCAIQFEVYSSTTQSYPIMIYVIGTGCNTSTSSPSPVVGWRIFKARVYNGTIDNITQSDSGGDGITASIIHLTQLTYDGVANQACRFKVYVNTGRNETTATAWIDYRLATIRADRLSG